MAGGRLVDGCNVGGGAVCRGWEEGRGGGVVVSGHRLDLQQEEEKGRKEEGEEEGILGDQCMGWSHMSVTALLSTVEDPLPDKEDKQ